MSGIPRSPETARVVEADDVVIGVVGDNGQRRGNCEEPPPSPGPSAARTHRSLDPPSALTEKRSYYGGFPDRDFHSLSKACSGSGGETSVTSCIQPGRRTWSLSGKHRLHLSYVILILAASTNGYDGALISALLSLPSFRRNLGENISPSYEGLIISAIALGGVLFFFPAAWLSDRLGRRCAVGLGAFIMTAAAVVQAFTRGPAAFLVTRLFLGIGLSFTQTASVLLNEIAHPAARSTVGSAYNALYYIGSITSAWITFATLATLREDAWAWRIPALIGGLYPCLLALGTVFVVPESPRWLVSQGRHEEARTLLHRLHGTGPAARGQCRFDPNDEFDEVVAAIAKERDEHVVSFSYIDFVRTPANRWRLFIVVSIGVMVQWAGQSPSSYYLSPILHSLGVVKPLQQAGLNGALAVWNLLWASTGSLLTERAGRRRLWLISSIGMLLAEVAYTISAAAFERRPKEHAAGYSGVVFLFFIYSFYSLAYSPLNFLYVIEINSFRSRAKGLALNQSIVFAFGFFNQWVNVIALNAIGWRYYLVFIGLLSCFIVAIYLVFPETKGLRLEQIEHIFEGGSLTTAFSLRHGIALEPEPPQRTPASA
ncbi:unnamed protein product [Parajaminaea phylloscopi]